MKVRIPLAGMPNQRDFDSLQTLIDGQDQRFRSVYIIPITNPITGETKLYVEKRPGFEAASVGDCLGVISSGSGGTALYYSVPIEAYITAFGGTNVFVDCTSVGSTVEEEPPSVEGRFVTVSNTQHGGSLGAYSDDNGVTWNEVSVPVNSDFISIAYGSSRFVVVSDSSNTTGMTSEDGITWASQALPTANQFYFTVRHNGTYFCAVAHAIGAGIQIAAKSADGLAWTQANMGGFMAPPRALAWHPTISGGIWATLNGLSGQRCLTSPDAVTWTGRTADNVVWSGAVASGPNLVAISISGFSISSNGSTWSATSAAATGVAIAADGAGRVVACQNQEAYVSNDDGATWAGPYTMGIIGAYGNLAYNGTVFCSTASQLGGGSKYSATSPDGVTWTERENLPQIRVWRAVGAAV